jgi:hypothetical protein
VSARSRFEIRTRADPVSRRAHYGGEPTRELAMSTTQNQAFAMTMFANAAQTPDPKSKADLAHQASAAITKAFAAAQPTIGNWQIVWGPAVPTQLIGPNSLNAMYVAKNVDSADYVIAIGGTNFATIFDWLVEDMFVFSQVPWPYGFLEGLFVAPGSAISLGTALGLSVLQSMRPDADLPGGGKTLVDFLRTIVTQPITLTVAGHSLGGALAPAVALWLANTQQDLLSLNWDPAKNATLSLQAFAGPTPGNPAFGTFLQYKLGEAGLNAHYNSLDAVPNAWQLVSPAPPNAQPALSQLYGLYASCVSDPSTIEAWQVLVAGGVASLLSLAGGDYQTLPGLAAFSGNFINLVYDASVDALTNYLKQMAVQHIPGYFLQFGYQPEWAPWTSLPQQQATTSAIFQAINAAGGKTATARDVVQRLQQRAPAKLQIGSAVVDAPTGPNDPQASTVAGLVHAALLKHGGATT